MNKNELRKSMLERRKMLSADQVQAASAVIFDHLITLPFFCESNLVFSYMPHGNEVDLFPLNRWILDHGKGLCLPRVLSGSEMDAVMVDRLEKVFLKNRFGILEPAKECQPADISRIDLILVPGLAFDREGNRLGHGKGYYDRFLEKCGENTFKIGIAFEFQVFDTIPWDIHDKRLDAVLTEKGLFNAGRDLLPRIT